MLTLWLLAGSLLAGPPAVPQAGIQTQTDPVRQALAEAADLVAAGDTSGAIGRLELAVESRPDEFQLLAELAWLYGFQASYVPEDFRERKAAEDYALRAWKLEPGHPSALGALALVRLKQLGPQNSGQLLDRALASPRFADLPADRRADVYYVQGLRYAREARDFEGLVRRPEKLPVATPTCSAFGLFCRNFSHPAAFNEMLERAGSLDFLAADERHQALEAFRTAVRLDPPHIEALSELLLILADDGAWGEYLQYARRGVEANPEAPRTHLLLGLGLHRSGHTEAAAESFERGLALLSPELRDAYGSPLSLLSVEDSARLWSRPGSEDAQNFRAIWAKLDPLYLTGANERWVEHLARVTHADLKFGEQGGEIRGSETDPGRIYVRYGPPRAIWSVVRDRSKETDALQMARGLALMECGAAGSAEPGASFKGGGPDLDSCRRIESGARHSLHGGGRYIFWNYLPDRPSLVFSRDLAMMNLRHMPASYSERYAEEVRIRLPSHYEPFELELEIPHQIARFKGGEPGAVSLETYAAFPLEELTGRRNRWAEIGMFFFDPGYTESHRWSRRVAVRRMPETYLIRNDLPLGSFEYSIEARDPVANTVAVARGALETRAPPADSLALSDLLAADAITVRSEPAKTRDDLFVRGSADLSFAPDEPVSLYWEVYGLAAAEGLARYEVTIAALDAEDRPLALRALRALGRVFGGGREQLEVSWTREIALEGRDRAIDWVELGALPEGQHRLVVTVRDLVAGSSARAERRVEVGQ